MKYLYLILIIATLSCSKPKHEDTSGISLIVNAEIVENKWWAISFTAGEKVTSTGTASVEWDVHNANGDFLYKRSATVNFTFNNAQLSVVEKTAVQGAVSMSARNKKITSFSGSGGYKFRY